MGDAAVVYAPSSVAAGDDILVGLNSFSTPPTIVEINASSDWNQLIALINRRTSQIPGSGSALSYVASLDDITASFVNSLRTRANALRSNVGLGYSAFSFGASLSSDDDILHSHLTDLRSAMSFVGVLNISRNAIRFWSRDDNPLGTPQSADGNGNVGGGTTISVGKSLVPGSGDTRRRRLGFAYPIPAGVNSNPTCSVTFTFDTYNNTLESYVPDIYAASSDISAWASGWWNTLSTHIGSLTYGTTTEQTLSVSSSAVAALAGANFVLIAGEDAELSGSGGSASSGHVATFQWHNFTSPPSGSSVLTLDAGF